MEYWGPAGCFSAISSVLKRARRWARRGGCRADKGNTPVGRGLWSGEAHARQIKEPDQPGAQHKKAASLQGSQSERRVWPHGPGSGAANLQPPATMEVAPGLQDRWCHEGAPSKSTTKGPLRTKKFEPEVRSLPLPGAPALSLVRLGSKATWQDSWEDFRWQCCWRPPLPHYIVLFYFLLSTHHCLSGTLACKPLRPGPAYLCVLSTHSCACPWQNLLHE